MAEPIEDYALLSDCASVALVGTRGSIDWLCLPRYDSASLFGALLGDERHGTWALAPEAEATAARHYDGDTFTVVTRWSCADGEAEVHDLMPIGGGSHVVRRVVGLRGTVTFVTSLRIRFDYARALPWVRQVGTDDEPVLRAVAGPDGVHVRGVRLSSSDHEHCGRVTVRADETRDLVLSWFPSFEPEPPALDVDAAIETTRTWWTSWAARAGTVSGPYAAQVRRSLLVLRALTHSATGGIVAAATTSLPEELGGSRNWDYRYVWLRDAALTLEAMIAHGELAVAQHWRDWLLRAVAGDPDQVQIMYGIAGERDLPERELTSLPGYQGAAPVRVGNGAATQFQADVLGEVMVALEAARVAGLRESTATWSLQRALLRRVIATIDRPDNGIWEVRGEQRMFTHSRVMVWAALDRGIRAVEQFDLHGDVDEWRRHRDRVADQINSQGVDPAGGFFTRSFGSASVDASLLLIPTVGFCAPDDPRMLATVARIESDLVQDGFVARYRNDLDSDGVAGADNPFLACSFWLVQQYAASGRSGDAAALMERLVALVNDVGLLSEEYDPVARRATGNVPQALSHLALVQAADALAGQRTRGNTRLVAPKGRVGPGRAGGASFSRR